MVFILLEKQMKQLVYYTQPKPQKFQMFAPTETLSHVFVFSGNGRKLKHPYTGCTSAAT